MKAMKRVLSWVAAAALLLTSATAMAEKVKAGEAPNLDTLSIDDRLNYEFNQDYATVISDVTLYSHDFLRAFLDKHWSTYTALAMPPEMRGMSEDEQRALLDDLHNFRVSSLVSQEEAEAKRIYLWPKGQVPATTEYTENTNYAYADCPEFEPYMLEVLVDKDVTPKGAVLLAGGGSHIFRSNVEEAYESALALNERGYQCFIVNYRVNPYTMQESALDFARAIRYVRAHAADYGINENRIACAGFSAGGSVISATLGSYTGDVNASVMLDSYVPDELDAVSADVNAYLSVYANYGEKSLNIEKAPATFFLIGGADGWSSVSDCYDAVRKAGIFTELHTFAGVPHGFGAGTHADGTVYENAATWPILADIFIQNAYAQAENASLTE